MSEKTVYDYTKLKNKIKDDNIKQKDIAVKAKMSPSTLSLKLNNKGQFYQDEIMRICNILKIKDAELSSYFFTLKV